MLAPRPPRVWPPIHWLAALAVSVALLACSPAVGSPSAVAPATSPATAPSPATVSVSPTVPTRNTPTAPVTGRGTLRVQVGEHAVGGQPVATPPRPVPTDNPGPFRSQTTVWITPVGRPTDVVAEGTASE